MPSRRSSNHRRLLLVPAAATLLIAACGGDDASGDTSVATTTPATAADTAPAATAAESTTAAPVEDDGGSWSFTDDAGATIELPARPERIVMFEDVAASLMDFGVRPAGIHYIQSAGNNLLDDFDLDGIESVGAACDQVDVESIAALRPELVVYTRWEKTDGQAFCLDATTYEQVAKVAPMLVLDAQGDAAEILTRYEALAASLGADVDGTDIAAKRARYEAAAARLSAVVAARPEISVIPMSITPTWAGVAEPGGFADLTTLRDDFGIDFAGPFDGEFTGAYWQEYSAETLTEARGDVVLMDAKNATPLADKVAAFPLWGTLPEVQAGQIVDWFVPGSFSYTRDAEFMESLAAAIESADDLVP